MVLSMREHTPAQQTPREVVDALFAAIQAGDREAILNLLSEDVECWVAGPPEIPYAGTFRGREEVARFFTAFNGAIDYESWQAQEFVAEGDTVVVIGEERWRARSTGRAADNPWAHILTVRDGKIVRFRAYEDTAASRGAFVS
jgi:ketosteroid isomerase-like protein